VCSQGRHKQRHLVMKLRMDVLCQAQVFRELDESKSSADTAERSDQEKTSDPSSCKIPPENHARGGSLWAQGMLSRMA